ncbi:ankyrin [Epithele typhae]|uniref:ankyrin n=1 Tax=Epithele typhae TaxID=378194 RepID=UPI0020084A52|nr:ankyrin [Epithele typhae]KAH9935183.1 ankyrin [Epithele typhae]
MSLATPTPDDLDEFLLSCRYGDVEDIQQFVDRFGSDALSTARDEVGNTVLHMVSGNGHTDALNILLPLAPPSLLSARNNAGSTPLHWAALNAHLPIAQALVKWPSGPGADLIDIKNAAGRSPLGEAENAGWDDGARWLVEVMKLDEGSVKGESANEKDDEELREAAAAGVEVEIEDAEGRVAKMTIGADGKEKTSVENTWCVSSSL